MGFFKCLAYVGCGIGAVVLAPVTGGGSLAVAIGAMGTTTLAGAAIGAGVGATAAAVAHSVEGKEKAYTKGVKEGTRAGEYIASQQYEKKISQLGERFKRYQDADFKLVSMYALGLATANADGHICNEEQEELDAFVSGCMAGYLPDHIKATIGDLSKNPPTLEVAVEYAKKAGLSKEDITDIIDIVAGADGSVTYFEDQFIDRWKLMSQQYMVA